MSGKRKQGRLSHEQVRRQVCFVCRGKAVDRDRPRPINDAGKHLVYRFICKDVPWDDPCIPSGLCRTCEGHLQKHLKWWDDWKEDMRFPPELPPVADFSEVVIFPPQTRAATSTHCECLICQVFYPGGIGKVSALSVPKTKDKGGRPKKRRTEE